MTEGRFDRNEMFFGETGQKKLNSTKIAVLGAGGLGSLFITQAALLGIGNITIIDNEEIEHSNRNRYFGVWHDDKIPGSKKVEIAERHVKSIDPKIEVNTFHEDIVSLVAIEVIKSSDYIIGCVDNDGVRYFINKVCLAYSKSYIDLASEILLDEFGGRIKIVNDKFGCLLCYQNLLDRSEIDDFYLPDEMRKEQNENYGLDPSTLDTSGPSVVSINGVVASLGVTALMTLVTKDEIEYDYLKYLGESGKLIKKIPASNRCNHCENLRGKRENAELNNLIKKNIEKNSTVYI